MDAVSDTGAGTVGEPEPLSATTAAGPFDPASHAAAAMEVDLTNVATSEAEPEAVVAGTPDEVEPDPELEGEGLFPPHLARWIWLAGALAQLRRVEARMQQMVMRMLRDA